MTTTPSDKVIIVDQQDKEILARPPRSLWSDAWRRLRRNKLAIIGMFYLTLLMVAAIFAPVFAPHHPGRPVGTELRERGVYRQAAWVEDVNPRRAGDWRFVFGTDSAGGDILSRTIYGARVSMVVGFIPMILTLAIGIVLGLVSGFAGGWLDSALMRFTDVVFALPGLLFFIIMQTAFGTTAFGKAMSGLLLLFVTLSIVSWPDIARLVRGQVLSLKEKEFVEAARAVGVSRRSIVFKHIFPNTLGPIIVAGAFIVPRAVIAEAILSYLGIGITPNISPDAIFPTSWGNMILLGKGAIDSQPWALIAPAIALASLTIAFVAIGDGLRDALDPRQQV